MPNEWQALLGLPGITGDLTWLQHTLAYIVSAPGHPNMLQLQNAKNRLTVMNFFSGWPWQDSFALFSTSFSRVASAPPFRS